MVARGFGLCRDIVGRFWALVRILVFGGFGGLGLGGSWDLLQTGGLNSRIRISEFLTLQNYNKLAFT